MCQPLAWVAWDNALCQEQADYSTARPLLYFVAKSVRNNLEHFLSLFLPPSFGYWQRALAMDAHAEPSSQYFKDQGWQARYVILSG